MTIPTVWIRWCGRIIAPAIHLSLQRVDTLVVPTAPTIRTRAEIAREPVRFNAQFGTYTNFTNLADLCALVLAAFVRRFQHQHPQSLWATGRQFPPIMMRRRQSGAGQVRIAVVGAHLSGMPLNVQLTSRHAVRVAQTQTAPCYRLYALANTQPPKPGLVKDDNGQCIDIELWDIPLARFGEFVAEMGMGTLQLRDGGMGERVYL